MAGNKANHQVEFIWKIIVPPIALDMNAASYDASRRRDDISWADLPARQLFRDTLPIALKRDLIVGHTIISNPFSSPLAMKLEMKKPLYLKVNSRHYSVPANNVVIKYFAYDLAKNEIGLEKPVDGNLAVIDGKETLVAQFVLARDFPLTGIRHPRRSFWRSFSLEIGFSKSRSSDVDGLSLITRNSFEGLLSSEFVVPWGEDHEVRRKAAPRERGSAKCKNPEETRVCLSSDTVFNPALLSSQSTSSFSKVFRRKRFQMKTFRMMAFLVMVFLGHQLEAAEFASLADGFRALGFSTEAEQKALFMLMRITKAFTEPLEDKSNVKRTNRIELFNKSNLKDLVGHISTADENSILTIASKISFPSIHHAQAYIFAATQDLWFRSTWQQETVDNPAELLNRWIPEKTVENNIDGFLRTLGLVEEINRPIDFNPNVIIWLGAIESSAAPRIKGDIPDGYSGEIVVHSNRRGLILGDRILETAGITQIAKNLNLFGNEKAIAVIEQTCRANTKLYGLSYEVLPKSTAELRGEIIKNLKNSNFLDNNIEDFHWPTEKHLYQILFDEAQQKSPLKLSKARLVFDDPEPRADNRIYDTYTQALHWLSKQSFDSNSEKKNLLALSVQPFVSFQQAVLERALGKYYKIVTVGPADQNYQQKDALESLAKTIYERGMNAPKIKDILPWIK